MGSLNFAKNESYTKLFEDRTFSIQEFRSRGKKGQIEPKKSFAELSPKSVTEKIGRLQVVTKNW